ncbi:MAG: hypothetical protein ACYSUA_04630, partial [Planctomycetota bacterium]
MKRAILASLIGLLAAGTASGQFQTSWDARMKAELIGVLTHTRLSVEFDGVPARAAFRSISAALATPVIARYSDDRFGHGIDPAAPLYFKAEDAPARLVLEMILEQCATYEPCIWQLRKGYIEVGTKERLSFPAAAESRLYNLRDLMLEPPHFVAPPLGAVGKGGGMTSIGFDSGGAKAWHARHPYACAALTRPAETRVTSGGGLERRKLPGELIQEIAEGIVETIEPGNWDYGQNNDEDDPETELARNGFVQGPWQVDVVIRIDKIARIRIWQDRLLIIAPDYIH